jgi:hypothetical protein
MSSFLNKPAAERGADRSSYSVFPSSPLLYFSAHSSSVLLFNMISILLSSLSSYRYCVFLSFLIPHHLLLLPEEQHLHGNTALDGFEVGHFNPEKKPRQFLKGLSHKNADREYRD